MSKPASQLPPSLLKRCVEHQHVQTSGRWLSSLLLLVLVTFALGLTIVRVVFPHVDRYNQQVTSLVSDVLDYPVSIGRLEAGFDNFSPYLILHDVSVYEATGQTLISIGQINLEMALFRTLYRFQPQVVDIGVLDTKISLRRDTEGEVYFQGIALGIVSSDQPRLKLPPFFADKVITVADIDVNYQDDQFGVNYQFNQARMTIMNRGLRHHLYAYVDMPDTLGNTLEVGLELEGPYDQYETWQGDFYMNAHQFQLKAWAQQALSRDDIWQGSADVTVWGRWQQNQVVDILADVEFHDVALQVSQALTEQNVFQFGVAEALIHYQKQNSQHQIDVHNLAFSSQTWSWPLTQMQLRFDWQGPLKLDFYSSYFHVADVLPLLSLVPDIRRHIEPQRLQGLQLVLNDTWLTYRKDSSLVDIHDKHPSNTVEPDTAALNGMDQQVVPEWTLQTQFSRASMPAYEAYPGFSNVSGTMNAQQTGVTHFMHPQQAYPLIHAHLQLDSEQATFEQPAWFEQSIAVQKAQGDIYIQREPLWNHIETAVHQNEPTTLLTPQHEWQVYSHDLLLINEDAEVTTSLQVFKPSDKAAVIGLDVHIDHGNLAETSNYMPRHLFSRELMQWMDQGLQKGTVHQGRFQMLGDLSRFPFRAVEGSDSHEFFQATFDISDLTLRYHEQWPTVTQGQGQLIFERQGMQALVELGKLDQTTITNTEIRIDDFRQNRVDIEGFLAGSTLQVQDFIKNSALKQKLGFLTRNLQADGQQSTYLNLKIPLDQQPVTVIGQSHFRDTVVNIPDFGWVLSEADFTLNYTQDNVSADAFTAKLQGQPIELVIQKSRTETDQVTRLLFETDVAIDTLLNDIIDLPLYGTTGWRGEIRSTRPIEEGQKPASTLFTFDSNTTVVLSSNLQGVTSDLPAPLLKAAAADRPIEIKLDWPADNIIDIAVDYDQWLTTRLRWNFDEVSHRWRPIYGWVYADQRSNFKRTTPQFKTQHSARPWDSVSNEALSTDFERWDYLPIRQHQTAEIRVAGRLHALDLDSWIPLIDRWTVAGADNNSASTSAAPGLLTALKNTRLHIHHLKYLGFEWPEADLTVVQQPQNWLFDVSNEFIQGQIALSKTDKPLELDLDYFNVDQLMAYDKLSQARSEPLSQVTADALRQLAQADTQAVDDTLLPAAIPAMQINVDYLEMLQWRLQNVQADVYQAPDGIIMPNLRIDDPALNAVGQAEWRYQQGRHETQIAMNLTTTDLGRGLDQLDFVDTIRDGQGNMRFDVTWQGAPHQFDFANLYGDARVGFENGQILDFNPGPGRLVGLMSLQAVPRRLSLDFKDLFAKGMHFDEMQGRFVFKAGVATTDDYVIFGPMGRIDIDGQIDLANEQYDQIITFLPDISSSLPIVGTIVGGPAGGAAVFVADRLARLFGKQSDHLAQIQYHLTGDWETPDIKMISRRDKKEQKTRSGNPVRY